MREARNPFRLRASEHIDSDLMFLRLFGPAVLSPLNLFSDGIQRIRIIQSAPGGGKTTLLRLFTPGPLRALHASRGQDESVKETYAMLKQMEILSDDGPRLLGVHLSCSKTFAEIADTYLNRLQKQSLFLALLDSRLILSALRSISVLHDLAFPDGLSAIEIRETETHDVFGPRAQKLCGDELYSRAQKTEDRICSALFSFSPQMESIEGHSELVSPFLFASDNIHVNGCTSIDQVVLMLDDAHRLDLEQRKALLDRVIDSRPTTGIWIAERKEALTLDQLVQSGTTSGRDYAATIMLEDHWRNKRSEFQKLVENIADRRARSASDAMIDTFGSCLDNSIDLGEFEGILRETIDAIQKRVADLVAGTTAYNAWIKYCAAKTGSELERALSWRGLEILIRRKMGRRQEEFDFELDSELYGKEEDASLRNAAEVFLAREISLPYYYGLERLSTLSSSNVEQFLMIAGDEFEESIARLLIQRSTALPAKRQHELIVRASRRLWNDVERRAGSNTLRLLRSIAEFSRSYTFRPTAPNDPSVNGIAILMRDRARLMDAEYLESRPRHKLVADAISSALQFNLLEPTLDIHVKRQNVMVLDLNRLLCAEYGLTLLRGQFKEQSLDTLADWIETGYQAPRSQEDLWE